MEKDNYYCSFMFLWSDHRTKHAWFTTTHAEQNVNCYVHETPHRHRQSHWTGNGNFFGLAFHGSPGLIHNKADKHRDRRTLLKCFIYPLCGPINLWKIKIIAFGYISLESWKLIQQRQLHTISKYLQIFKRFISKHTFWKPQRFIEKVNR